MFGAHLELQDSSLGNICEVDIEFIVRLAIELHALDISILLGIVVCDNCKLTTSHLNGCFVDNW